MLENILTNIAYSYYPKNICSFNEKDKYKNSLEFKKLQHILNSFYDDAKNLHALKLLEKEFSKNIKIHKIQDRTSLSFDRCLSYELEIIENDNVLVRICLNISLIVPYYVIYILENKINIDPYKWLTLPIRNKKMEMNTYSSHINSISLIVEKKLNINLFPEKFLHIIIPDLSFQENSFNEFTYFNAFFLDNKVL